MISYYLEKSGQAAGIGVGGTMLAEVTFDQWLSRGVMFATIIGALVPACIALHTWWRGHRKP